MTSLAPQTVNDIFKIATLCLSERAKTALEARGWSSLADENETGPAEARHDHGRKRWVSPHDLRHTAVVLRLKRYIDSGTEMEDALGKLRVYFGWSHKSTMPFHYARAYWQTDAADLSDDRFDRHIEALRYFDASLHARSIL